MQPDWSALGEVAAVSTGVTVGVVAVFALGVLGLSRAGGSRDGATVSYTAAGLCSLACAAVVAYGICPIVPQFHS
ncbi:hypothetical protein ACIP98_00865 [Streptomyces sp. NPDC088354]|uniref:hypothetical protein n=1 Tax=Streptomyces sp. NPDC088354 TaxID=3365856 RepID=UPI003814E98E